MSDVSVLVFTFVLITCTIHGGLSMVDKDLILTRQEKETLDRFKELVLHRLPHEYMKTEIYLIRWLRARHFDVRGAEAMLVQNLNWRKENDIDNILSEDWSDEERNLPFKYQGCDKEGRPVLSLTVKDWDIRRAVISGKGNREMRYYDRIFEFGADLIRRGQKDGSNVTQFTFLSDEDGFNLRMHGCPMCLRIFMYALQSLGAHYPGIFNSAVFINAPSAFRTAWTILRTVVSGSDLDRLAIYGRDEWKRVLEKQIDPSERTIEFGGFNEQGLTITEVTDAVETEPMSCHRLGKLRDDKNMFDAIS